MRLSYIFHLFDFGDFALDDLRFAVVSYPCVGGLGWSIWSILYGIHCLYAVLEYMLICSLSLLLYSTMSYIYHMPMSTMSLTVIEMRQFRMCRSARSVLTHTQQKRLLDKLADISFVWFAGFA